ncbi:YfhO family protein [Carnobacterium funditum]|uniref:YfhO family protein n=1 Tax=Carnobacterium funditum TaxID=2752 RepID=UPI001FDFE9F1|nr:YfhO family protein [Carnobacterium funditum]
MIILQFSIKSLFNNQWPLLLAFFIPGFILAGIYIVQGVYPFGNSSLLTVDLGQQYVDFFSYYRQTFYEDPSSFFYSFSKAIGGDMVGLWAYYLTSPFNLIFLIFPQSQISLAITCLTLLKISLAGLSFGWLLKKSFNGHGFILAAFSVSYALMGYTIVNQLNVMWLDGLIFLPLIAMGIEILLFERKGLTYSLFLALALFSNYYIAYMICLFLVGYFVFRLVGMSYLPKLTFKQKIKANLSSILLFGWHSLLGAGLSAFLLLPTFYSLLKSKASYTKLIFDWDFSFPFHEMLSKLMIGAFNFDQMPSGYPNIFIGSLALISFGFYFSNRSFPLRERITGLLLIVFFVVSMNLKAFNMVWHALQYPIWYPYRFSFVVCFFMILNGYRSFMKMHGLRPLETFFSVILITIIGISVYENEYDFIQPSQIVLTIVFSLLIIFMLIIKPQRYYWLPFIFFLVTLIEMGANAQIDLSRLSYVKQDSFSTYQHLLNSDISTIKNKDSDFYRIEKTFSRSKNDSFQANFPSVSHFSSTFEREIPNFFGHLGLPVGDGFVSYSNGTLLTDSILGIKYYISEQNELYRGPQGKTGLLKKTSLLEKIENNQTANSINTSFQLSLIQTKPDLRAYQPFHESDKTVLYENPYALPILFGSNKEILNIKPISNQPIQFQEDILRSLAGLSNKTELFIPTVFDTTVYQNVSVSHSSQNQSYVKQIFNEDASVTFQFKPETNDSYYLTLDPNVKEEDVTFYLNGIPFTQYSTYRDLLVLNLAHLNKDDTITFKVALKKSSLSLKDFELYRLDQKLFSSAIKKLQQNNLTIENQSNTLIQGNLTIQPDQQLLFTSIPYSQGWSALVDGVPVETKKALNSLLVIPIKSGKHSITLKYQTPWLKEGIILTIIVVGVLLLTHLIEKKVAYCNIYERGYSE